MATGRRIAEIGRGIPAKADVAIVVVVARVFQRIGFVHENDASDRSRVIDGGILLAILPHLQLQPSRFRLVSLRVNILITFFGDILGKPRRHTVKLSSRPRQSPPGQGGPAATAKAGRSKASQPRVEA